MSRLNGSMVLDSKGNPVQVGSSFKTSDATGTPLASPLAYSNSIIPIIVPSNAIQLIVFPTTDLRISEVALMTTYDVIPGGIKESIPCAELDTIYVVRDSADGSLRFKFVLLG